MQATSALRSALLFIQLLCVVISLYQTAVTTLGLLIGRRLRSANPGQLPRFGVVVCARNEGPYIAAIVRDLLSQDYPAQLRQVVVVAHNCTDDTAGRARAAGAHHVIELSTLRPGKAHAILAGLPQLGRCDIAGMFDADSRAEPNLLREVALAMRSLDCVQVESSSAKSPEAIAQGLELGRRLRNALWFRPREALGLPVPISGSGFFIRPGLIRELLPEMRTLTEDLELAAVLTASGHHVAFLSATRVTLQEPEGMAALVSQRTRWARGHFGVIRSTWPALARRALHGDFKAADFALYLLVPTRTITRLGVSLGLALAVSPGGFGLPLRLAIAAFTGEWATVAWVGVRQRLVPFNLHGLALAIRQGVFGLMWFPIGLWALATVRQQQWSAAKRNPDLEATDVALAN
jgi:cellulose synthase/poly-beta-1,6-N-acetylglucosamine synthase-like glycosyltransferase